MPPDRRCVKTKWVFKIKRNGIFRAHLVACGYSKISGVDYTENYALFINDVTWSVLLIVMSLKKNDGKLIEIEVALLHGDLEEEIYMDCPQGLEDAKEDECVKLLHTICGLVQLWFSSISTSILEGNSECFEEHGIQGWSPLSMFRVEKK